MIFWVKVFKNGPSKICERQPLKNFTWSILKYLDPFAFLSSVIMILLWKGGFIHWFDLIKIEIDLMV